MTYSFSKENIDYLLSVLKDEDTVTVSGKDMIDLINSGKTYSGRKPIPVDVTLFDKVVERWCCGEISAREAMRQLNLKPNTFYRRIKERNNIQMKNIRDEIEGAKNNLRSETNDIRKDIHSLGKQFYEDVKEIRQSVDDKIHLMDIENEIKLEKISAKLSHREEVDDLRAEVMKEALDHKTSEKQ